jgi:hypothetical protein
MITGSGDHSRDQIISGTPMFKVLAEGLADAGIASLRLDDRGTAASTGPTQQGNLPQQTGQKTWWLHWNGFAAVIWQASPGLEYWGTAKGALI